MSELIIVALRTISLRSVISEGRRGGSVQFDDGSTGAHGRRGTGDEGRNGFRGDESEKTQPSPEREGGNTGIYWQTGRLTRRLSHLHNKYQIHPYLTPNTNTNNNVPVLRST